MVLLAAGLAFWGVDWAVFAVDRSRLRSLGAPAAALLVVLFAAVVDSRIEPALVDVLLAPAEPDV